MKFKFRNLLMTAGALLAFTACSSDDAGTTPATDIEAQVSDLELIVSIPNYGATTRGEIESAVTEEGKKASIEHVSVWVKQGDKTLNSKTKITENENGTFSVTLHNVPVRGGEKVVIVGGNDEAHMKDDLAIKIADVQPTTEKAGIKNAAYAIEVPLEKTDNSTVLDELEGGKYTVLEEKKGAKTVYTVYAKMESIVARTEFSGSIQYNDVLVSNAYISNVTPMGYTEKYKGTALVNDVENALGKDLADKALDEKVLANHLFDGDTQSFNIEVSSTLYNCVGASDKKYLNIDADEKTKSAVYIANDELVDVDYFAFDANSPVKVVKVEYKEGENTITEYQVDGKLEFTTTETTQQEYLKKYAQIINDNKRYFTIGNFENTSGTDKGTRGIYSGGHIYQLNFKTGLVWGGTDQDKFSPDEDKGTEEPQVTQLVDILAKVKVVDWTSGEYKAEIK